MKENEVSDFFAEVKQGKVKKLMGVGFTEEQASLLVEMMSQSSTGFGIF